MSRRNHRGRKRTATDSHPLHFSQLDLREMATERDKWLDHTNPLDCISVEVVRRCQSEAMRGAWAQMQWTWEQLEPADPILATCVERRLSALRRIPWDIVKKEGLSDAEDLLAEAQLRTLTDFANALENLDEGIAALAQASFRHFRHIQLYETELGTLRLNCTDNWNWCRDGYAGAWQWNPAATYGRTIGEPLPVAPGSIVSRLCARPIDLPAMMLCLDRKNAKAQWQVFNGRYGTPAVFAIMPQGISENMRADYIRFARQCISNAAGVLPHGSDVKTVQPGSGGPDTFARLLEVSTQELVLRATGGLMTMLTAPGAGTNTATGSAHQDAFDDLAAAEAEEIAAVLNEKLFAPVLDQWHPGQPHLVEFIMKRPDSDNAAGAVQNIVALAGAGYKTEAEQASGLTGLQLEYHEPLQQAAMAGQAESALNSLRVRFAPTMLYPPARVAFEAALNSRGGSGTKVPRSEEAEELPLNEGELAALRALGGGIDPAQVAADAELVAREMMAGLEVATNGCTKPGCEKHPRKGDATGAMQAKQKGGRGTKGNPQAKRNKTSIPANLPPNATDGELEKALEKKLNDADAGKGNQEVTRGDERYTISVKRANHRKKHKEEGANNKIIAKTLVQSDFEKDGDEGVAYTKGVKVVKQTDPNTGGTDIPTAYKEDKVRLARKKLPQS